MQINQGWGQSGYHPQSNGQTERENQELETSLRCMDEKDPSTWASHLTWVEYANNNLNSSAPGVTHFEASLGDQPSLLISQEVDRGVRSVQEYIAQSLAKHTSGSGKHLIVSQPLQVPSPFVPAWPGGLVVYKERYIAHRVQQTYQLYWTLCHR